mgnify:CR=1 FL=1
MKGEKTNKKEQPKEVKIGFSTNNSAPKIVSKKSSKSNREKSGIPSYVANRMARRVAITTGLPTLSRMGVFIASYLIIIKGIADIPPGITLVSSAICFLIGLLGLSYGILSASWDDTPGTILGLENIRPNIKRMRGAFRSTESRKQESS